MSDVVERVAAALFAADDRSRLGCAPHSWKNTNHYWRNHYTHLAAAVVAALGLKKGYDPARDCLVVSYVEPSEQGSSE